MKLLAIIFSFYLLLLPALPCSDTNECNSNGETTTLQTDNHQQHRHEDEGCNPFCNCACCGQNVASSFQPNKITIVKPVYTKQLQHYKNAFLSSSFLDSIWQPPKYS